MNTEQGEKILDGVGRTIKKAGVVLTAKEWRKMAGVLLVAIVAISGVIITVAWANAKSTFNSFKEKDEFNTALVGEVRKNLEFRLVTDEERIRKLEDANLQMNTNFEWIKSFLQHPRTVDALSKVAPPHSDLTNSDK